MDALRRVILTPIHPSPRRSHLRHLLLPQAACPPLIRRRAATAPLRAEVMLSTHHLKTCTTTDAPSRVREIQAHLLILMGPFLLLNLLRNIRATATRVQRLIHLSRCPATRCGNGRGDATTRLSGYMRAVFRAVLKPMVPSII